MAADPAPDFDLWRRHDGPGHQCRSLLSFARNGDLYHICLAANSSGRHTVLVVKSFDGGLHWSSPAILWDTSDKRYYPDFTRITADRTDARYVYATWDNCDSGNRGQGILSRTTDGG